MKPIAISNTGPLIALAKAGVIHILNGLFGKVVIPDAVRREITAGTQIGTNFAEISSQCHVLEVYPDPDDDPLLNGVLDRGEAAVVLLARKIQPDVTLLDERKGRKIAGDVFHLKVIGSAGLLVKAKREGLLDDVRSPLNRMRSSGYYIHEKIYDHILRLAKELP